MHKQFNTNQNQRNHQWERNLQNFTTNRDFKWTDRRRINCRWGSPVRTFDLSLSVRRKRKGLLEELLDSDGSWALVFYYSGWSSTTRFYNINSQHINPTLHVYSRINGPSSIPQGLIWLWWHLIREIRPLKFTICEGSVHGDVLNCGSTIWLYTWSDSIGSTSLTGWRIWCVWNTLLRCLSFTWRDDIELREKSTGRLVPRH